ncbi:hypothetical protein [Thermodesulfovibrio yellowstonii]|uniref:Uncharacterized protein n=1 Tax=Thermodesulfovibrio yellowstonii (strain ATCC 51303 / DSM 11347 / YP87) TaxID=289376 RepID=B5YIJ4_THEYD|nr:hypothetical protein [Thermodesulfovibrio yellowstonii]ACI21224.1 hypothetical protein THEYE_A0305 [Thermodesulfovibrio yellowstonii DSM 11347]
MKKFIIFLFMFIMLLITVSNSEAVVLFCDTEKVDCRTVAAFLTLKEEPEKEKTLLQSLASPENQVDVKISEKFQGYILPTLVLVKPKHILYQTEPVLWKATLDLKTVLVTLNSGFVDLEYKYNKIYDPPTLVSAQTPVFELKKKILESFTKQKYLNSKDITASGSESQQQQNDIAVNTFIQLIRDITKKYIINDPNILVFLTKSVSNNPTFFQKIREEKIEEIERDAKYGKGMLQLFALKNGIPVVLDKIHDNSKSNYDFKKDLFLYLFASSGGVYFAKDSYLQDHPVLNALAVEILMIHYYDYDLNKFIKKLKNQ